MRTQFNHPNRLAPQVIPSNNPITVPAQKGGQPVRSARVDGFESLAAPRNSTSASKSGDVQSQLRQQFGALAADKQQFHAKLRGIFGEGYDSTKAEQLRQQALEGNFEWMPPVKWVAPEVLGAGHGAYDAESGTVLLSTALQVNPSLAASTYVEEAGHHLDAQLNTVDSQGDEGELFRRILGGEKLSRTQIAEIRAENDKGLIQLEGRSVEVEYRFWDKVRDLGKKVVDGVKDAVDTVVDTVTNAAETVIEGASNAVEWTANAVGNVVEASVEGVKNLATRGIQLARQIPTWFGLGSQPDRQFDGRFVGAGPETFPPGTPLDQIPAVTPTGNPNATGTILYVNGIVTDLEGQRQEMQDIANTTNMRVIGIHNSTEGWAVDLAQSTADKLDKGSNAAVDTLADTIYAELKAGRNVHLMGYSQGGLITGRALKHVENRLRMEDGLSKEQTQQLMSRINVETFGSAGAVYPDGPNYVHYINDRDIVPNWFGLGNDTPDPFNLLTDPGRGAVVHHFKHGKRFQFAEAHDLENAYLSRWVPFEQARRGEF